MPWIHCMGAFFYSLCHFYDVVDDSCVLSLGTWPPEGLFGMMHVHDYAGGISWIKGHHASKT